MGKVIDLFKGEKQMISIFDVANYFINMSDEENPMTPLKLQKLCYYAQAWSLAWDGTELFDDEFQAWVHGPANYDLYCKYNGARIISNTKCEFDKTVFSCEELETLDAVWDGYGNYSGKYLEQLTHEEGPWLKTRGKLHPGTASDKIIAKELMKEYYSSL